MSAPALPETRERPAPVAVGKPVRGWRTIVWDDPVNLMSYVTYVFQQHFGFSRAQAERLMHQVNDDGRAIVATGPRESMEAHVQSMHGYGLQATVDKAPEA